MRVGSYRCSYEEAFVSVKLALQKLAMEIEKEDFERKTIVARAGMSIWSWGELIQVNFRVDNGIVEVAVESNSPAQLLTWGKNDENEEAILNQTSVMLENK